MATNARRTLKIPEDKTKRGRGRPRGSTDHPGDHKLLSDAAQLIIMRQASSPSNAFKALTDGDDTTVRRLQRKWSEARVEYLRSAQQVHNSRWERDLQLLSQTLPLLYARVVRFSLSRTGKALLRQHSEDTGAPAHPMSLGIASLFELIDEEERKAGKNRRPQLYPTEGSPDDNPNLTARRFQKAIDGWIDGGFEVSSESLRELARRCNGLADELEAEAEFWCPKSAKKTND